MKRYREDKRPEDADTIETVREIYARQGGEKVGSLSLALRQAQGERSDSPSHDP